jgi:hypothetical protein
MKEKTKKKKIGHKGEEWGRSLNVVAHLYFVKKLTKKTTDIT